MPPPTSAQVASRIFNTKPNTMPKERPDCEPFRFLELPKELRRMVYDVAFVLVLRPLARSDWGFSFEHLEGPISLLQTSHFVKDEVERHLKIASFLPLRSPTVVMALSSLYNVEGALRETFSALSHGFDKDQLSNLRMLEHPFPRYTNCSSDRLRSLKIALHRDHLNKVKNAYWYPNYDVQIDSWYRESILRLHSDSCFTFRVILTRSSDCYRLERTSHFIREWVQRLHVPVDSPKCKVVIVSTTEELERQAKEMETMKEEAAGEVDGVIWELASELELEMINRSELLRARG